MSLIHKALNKNNPTSAPKSSTSYNPLAQGTSESSSKSIVLIGLAIILIVGVALTIFWPTQASPELSDRQDASIKAELIEAPVIEPVEVSTESAAQSKSVEPDTTEKTDLSAELIAEIEGLSAQVEALKAQSQTTAPTVNVSTKTVEPEAEADENNAVTVTPLAAQETSTSQIAAITPTKNVQVESSTTKPVLASNKPAEPVRQSSPTFIQTTQSQWQNKVESAMALGNIEEAELRLKEWIDADARDETPRIWLARIYLNNKAERSAEPLLKGLKSVDAQALIGLVYERTGRHALAATTFERLYRNEPSNGRWLLFWAINSEREGQLEKTAQLYQTYLQAFPYEDAALSQFVRQRLTVLGGSR